MTISRTIPILIVYALMLLGSLASCTSASYAAPSLGVVVDSNLTVLDVQKGSAAEKAGVLPNDVLLKLNGTTPASFTEWATEISNMEVGQTYTITVQRSSDIVELSVVSTRYPAESFPPGVTPTIIPTNQYYIR
jgi:S1-C subfamily serine protease